MKLLRYFVIAAAVGLTADAGTARAGGFGDRGCSNCGHGGLFGGFSAKPPTTLFQGHAGNLHPKLPAYQAAPWYLYWPYDGHFMTPAPIGGQFYGPPMTGNFPVNPYFPSGPGYGFGHGIPGGPPPGYHAVPPAPMPPGR